MQTDPSIIPELSLLAIQSSTIQEGLPLETPTRGGVLHTLPKQSTPTLRLAPVTTSPSVDYSPITVIGSPPDTVEQPLIPWNGFKLVGNNLDKNFHRRHQTFEKQTRSFHFFHYYAVKDRVQLAKMDDTAPEKPLKIKPELFLPTKAGLNGIESNFTTYIARYIQTLVTQRCLH